MEYVHQLTILITILIVILTLIQYTLKLENNYYHGINCLVMRLLYLIYIKFYI